MYAFLRMLSVVIVGAHVCTACCVEGLAAVSATNAFSPKQTNNNSDKCMHTCVTVPAIRGMRLSSLIACSWSSSTCPIPIRSSIRSTSSSSVTMPRRCRVISSTFFLYCASSGMTLIAFRMDVYAFVSSSRGFSSTNSPTIFVVVFADDAAAAAAAAEDAAPRKKGGVADDMGTTVVHQRHTAALLNIAIAPSKP